MNKETVKTLAQTLGAEKCGIAEITRFDHAPQGFHPRDVYPKARSAIVVLKSMPSEIITCPNPVPYTNAAFLIYPEIDRLGLELARHLEKSGIGAVPVPCDTPYLHWEAHRLHGQGILSMRHAGALAGLGYLGKNTLLINRDLGNMVYIGVILTAAAWESDPLETASCPADCRICLDSCPQQALTGETVLQERCRKKSFIQNERGFTLYNCCECRRLCPRRTGFQ